MKATDYFSKLPVDFKKHEKLGREKVLTLMLKDSDRYVPHDTGATREEAMLKLKDSMVVWSNEYVEWIYWGINFRFQKVHNQEAQAMWADEAAKKFGDKWAEEYTNEILKAF